MTTLNPVQPEALDRKWLYREFGDRSSFCGGISTQCVLPRGVHGEISAATDACIHSLAPDGMGLLLGPSHPLPTDIPMAGDDTMQERLPS